MAGATNGGFLDRHTVVRATLGVFGVLGYLFCYLATSDIVAILLGGTDRALPTIVTGCAFTALSLWFYKSGAFGVEAPEPVRKWDGVRSAAKWLCLFAVMSLVLQGIFIFVFSSVADPGMDSRAEAIQGSDMVLFTILSVSLAPLSEECVFRVFCYNLLKRSWSTVPAMAITSFLFGAVHGTLAHVVSATMLGILLCTAYEFTGRWWVPVLGHMTYNVLSVFFLTEAFYNESTKPQFFILFVLTYVVVMSVMGSEMFVARRRKRE